MNVSESGRQNVHLLVLIHGLWGSPRHLQVANEEVVRIHSNYTRSTPNASDLHVLVPTANSGTLTYDGMDVCAARVLVEVKQKITELEQNGKRIREFSVMGYSLGGLVARYFVGLLAATDRSFFAKHRPLSFSTLATPHLGILKYKNRFWQWVAVKYGHRLLGRSGDQLYFWDRFDDQQGDVDENGKNRDRRPLLEVMADPRGLFIRAINKFERIAIFANAVQDTTVPYPTGAIDTDDHFVYDELCKHHDDVIIETDSDHIISRWYTAPNDNNAPPPTYNELFHAEKNVPINVPLNASHEDFVVRIEPIKETYTAPIPVKKEKSDLPFSGNPNRSATFKLDNKQFIVSMMRIIMANKTKRVRPSVLPPFLRFRRPLNWLFYASMPILMPVFMVLVVAIFHWDSLRSRRRVQLLGYMKNAVMNGLQSASGSSALRVLAVAELTRLITAGEDGFLSMTGAILGVNMGEETGVPAAVSPSSQDLEDENAVEFALTRVASDSDSQGRASSDGTMSTLDRIDAALDCESSTSMTSSRRTSISISESALLGEPRSLRDSKLQMTPLQLKVAVMLNRGLDPLKTKKYLTWFPDVPNAHAAIVVRDGPLFPEQEIGRAVVRRWANLTIPMVMDTGV